MNYAEAIKALNDYFEGKDMKRGDALRIAELISRAEKAEKIVDEYTESARAIALWLYGFCNKKLSYPSMISDAARKISTAYADIREILGDNYDISRLRELVQADVEGKTIIAPAQICESVYHITTCKDFPKVLDGTMYGSNGECGTATGYYCPCELAENCPSLLEEDGFFDCDNHKNTEAIYEDVVTEIVINDMESFVRLDYSGCVDFDDFGKTVFLTREAAENALKERDKNEKGNK